MLCLQGEAHRPLVDPLLALEVSAPQIGVAELRAHVLDAAHRLPRRGQRVIGAAELGVGAGEPVVEIRERAHEFDLRGEPDALLVEARRLRPVLSRHGQVGLAPEDVDLDLVK